MQDIIYNRSTILATSALLPLATCHILPLLVPYHNSITSQHPAIPSLIITYFHHIMADSPATGVIDLTSTSSDEADTPANITPDRPSKRSRSSRRLEAHCVAKSDRNDKVNTNSQAKEKDHLQEYEADNINGYFDIDQVLDRRTRRYKGREVVEYCKFFHVNLF